MIFGLKLSTLCDGLTLAEGEWVHSARMYAKETDALPPNKVPRCLHTVPCIMCGRSTIADKLTWQLTDSIVNQCRPVTRD